MINHVFISYSVADGLNFATRLFNELEGGHPHINAWLDKNRLKPGEDWDNQLANAVSNCKCLVFVMSPDSTSEGSTCKHEWAWALKYKKPVVPLLIDKKAQLPFRLGSRQYIDFTTNFEAGIKRLRNHIAYLNSEEGKLNEMRHRFEDANRDLRRAKPEEQPRIQAEITELKKQIEIQQKIVDNPEAAQAQTQKNIETGLVWERKPEEKTKNKETFTKFINPPPGIAPNYFQDRIVETKQIVDFLNDDAQRLMTVVGRGGVGKTAMICRLLKCLEAGELPDGLGKMKVDGIVYLSESGSHRAAFANIFYDICKLLPGNVAGELDAIYKNPQGSTESKMHALLERFQGARVLLLLDNFEPLVDTESLAIRDAELDEALRAFLKGTHTAVNIVITTRVAPRKLNLIQPGRQRVLTLDEGLESPYAENILRKMDSDGRLGLQSATDELLKRAKEKTRGFPRALEALFAILASDRYTTLEELLAMPTPENVVEALVGEAFNRLDTNAQKVMQALAVYNRPVTPAAVDYLLAPYMPAMDSAPVLQRLANMHFARKESRRFYLHPVDREFAFDLIPNPSPIGRGELSAPNLPPLPKGEGRESDGFTQHHLTTRAADYFAQARKPRAEWKKLEDLFAQLAEFDLRCSTGDYDTAAKVLTDFDGEYLLLWGHYRLMIDLHEKTQGNLTDNRLSGRSLDILGSTYKQIGEVRKAIYFFEKALQIARENKYRQAEGTTLGNLGTVYADLGDVHKAIEFYEQSLVIAREIGVKRSEGMALGNLGTAYADLGDAHKAIEYYEQALVIAREIGDRIGESVRLGNIGNQYEVIGDDDKAFSCFAQSLEIKRDIGDRQGEAIFLYDIGNIYIARGNYRKATEYFQQSIRIADEISIPLVQLNVHYGFAQAYLLQNDLSNARASVEAALQYDVPQYNHTVSALHGLIALRQGNKGTARQAFRRTIAQADELLTKTPEYYSALDAKGLALCGLALCVEDSGQMTENRSKLISDAVETFKKARKIAPHAWFVKENLRLFDGLVKCDGEGILKDVRSAVEGTLTVTT